MPHAALTIVPGVNTEKTLALNESGVSASSFIRWRDGMAEKRGGWTKFVNTPFAGTIRSLHAWQDLSSNDWLAVGSTTNLNVYNGTVINDITAQAISVPSIAVSLTTTSGSSIVTVTDTGRNATIYNVVVFNTPVSVGGLVLSGSYQIVQGGLNTYNIVATSNATSSVTNGGAVPYYSTTTGAAIVTVNFNNHGYAVGSYYQATVPTSVGGITISGNYIVTSATTNSFTIIAANSASSSANVYQNAGNLSLLYYIGQGPAQIGSGYGGVTGGYGAGAYGTGVAAPPVVGTEITATDYWLANWGEILMSCPTGGMLFTWSSDTGFANAVPVATAPLVNNGMILVMPEQQVMVWGSTYGSISDPLQIRWSDVGNYSVWTPTSTNQAGGYHVPTGSRIIACKQVAQQVFVFTDIDLYVGQYVGYPYVWGFTQLAQGCGLIAPKAVVVQGSAAYWMSQKQFFVNAGNGVEAIPCPVWDIVFQNLNTAYANNIRAASNSQFNEITWYYPSTASNSGENDSYVTYNTKLNEWDYGSLNRTAWIDQSVLGGPIGGCIDGYVYQHETSNDASGSAINASLTTGYFTLSEAEDLVFVDWMFPDMKWGTYSGSQNANVQFTFNVLNYLGDTPRTYGPYVVNKNSPYIPLRIRGRYLQVTISSSDTGSFWRMGKIRFRYAPDGKR
jgi:hypothetical protein